MPSVPQLPEQQSAPSVQGSVAAAQPQTPPSVHEPAQQSWLDAQTMPAVAQMHVPASVQAHSGAGQAQTWPTASPRHSNAGAQNPASSQVHCWPSSQEQISPGWFEPPSQGGKMAMP